MKKFLLPILIFFAFSTYCQAQNPILWGVTDFGGTKSDGNIFQVNGKGNVTSMHSFGIGTDGVIPQNSLFRASDGLLYGMTVLGGSSSDGIIFSYNIATAIETNLHNFTAGSDGQVPYGSLMQASNGLIYGMTYLGGTYSSGIIFSLDISTGTETVLYSFGNGKDGWGPTSTFIQASNGLLYGTTVQGGTTEMGTIFSYNISTGVETVLHDFGSGTDGHSPNGSLLQASNGLLYGMTDEGGTNDSGTIYSYDITSGTETVLYSFSGSDGALPNGSLMQAGNGVLYGLTGFGGANYRGVLFSYDITSGTETNLHDFGIGTDGTIPLGTLFQASDSLLYGTTDEGGTTGYYGMLFNYNISTNAYSDFHDFNGVDGANLWGNLIEVDTLLTVTPPQASTCAGNSVTFTASGAATYTWSPSAGLNTTTGDTVVATPTATTTYVVTGTIFSTTYTDTVVVSVTPAPNTPTITISVTGDTLFSSAVTNNQWYLNDTLITGAINQYLVVTGQPGSYSVTVVNPANGCSSTSEAFIVTGIDNMVVNSSSLLIYPNPSSDFINISLLIKNPQSTLLSLYNMLGQQVWSANIGGQNHYTIPVNDLANGVYILSMNVNGIIWQKKIVIEK